MLGFGIPRPGLTHFHVDIAGPRGSAHRDHYKSGAHKHRGCDDHRCFKRGHDHPILMHGGALDGWRPSENNDEIWERRGSFGLVRSDVFSERLGARRGLGAKPLGHLLSKLTIDHLKSELNTDQLHGKAKHALSARRLTRRVFLGDDVCRVLSARRRRLVSSTAE